MNPLMELLTDSKMNKKDRLLRFFNEYYENSDIDVICNKSNIFEFMDKVDQLYNIILKNLNKISGKDISDKIKIVPYKSLRIAITIEYIELCMSKMDTNVVLNELNSDEIREYFYFEYINIKRSLNKKLSNIRKKNKLYNSYLKPTKQDDMILLLNPYKISKNSFEPFSTDYCIYLNDILPDEKKVDSDNNIVIFKMSDSIKFKIECNENSEEKILLHNIEIFQTKYPEFFSIVSRFHCSYVRAYYQGNDVKMLPSAVSGFKTGISMDYKYVAGKYDPIHIFNKNRVRGFGVLLNQEEISYLVKYNKKATNWKNIFKIGSSKNGIINHLGPRKIDDEIFKLSKHKKNLPNNIYKKLDYTYIESMDDLYDAYKLLGYDPKKVGIDLLKLKTINNDGTIRPFNRSLLNTVWYFMK
jgi:hypothetical protein